MKKACIWIMCFALVAAIAACASSPRVSSDEELAQRFYQDKKITTLIFKKFNDDKLTRSHSITPRCYDGHVYLIGEYEKADEKNRAIAIAGEVEGVVSLETHLLPRAGRTEVDDQEDVRLSGEVKKRIADSGAVSTSRLDIVAVQGTIVLVGIVKSERELARATEIAQTVEGVQSVVSFLNVLR